ncbi:sigma factor-like helix-turn-helix DNA-binding protein [Rhizobium sp. S163]|uniref:sigma-70 region 4 domain-containing protein n=1 Tax=Rhizobium sp. S163 TaxID=3055039 RepID=UPI0025A9D4CC|nr:sigma factor-like helix-turn-helix DNA-binding protein [Rhizobium sp. S163]MDM9645609.1 sigma factor-like helix-turn-helix DNA-binding protein [Rhizobium sp. S163]
MALHDHAKCVLLALPAPEARSDGIDEKVVRQACHGPPQEWHVVGHELERACGALPEPYKSAFEFVFILGRSYEEAALHFHCPAGTVKSRVNRARMRLSHDMDQRTALS